MLERTLGVPIFQEQVIKLAMVAAGLGLGLVPRMAAANAVFLPPVPKITVSVLPPPPHPGPGETRNAPD